MEEAPAESEIFTVLINFGLILNIYISEWNHSIVLIKLFAYIFEQHDEFCHLYTHTKFNQNIFSKDKL